MLRVVSRAVCTSPLTYVKTLSPGASTDCAADGEVSPTTTLTVFLAPPTGHGTRLITTSRTGGCDPRNAARPTSPVAGLLPLPVGGLLGRSSDTKKEVAGAHVPGVHAGLPFVATVERGGTSYTVDMPTPRHGRSTVLFVSISARRVTGRITSLQPVRTGTDTTVVPVTRNSLMTKGHPAMQRPALSTQLVELAEDLNDDFVERYRDGEICSNDVAHLMPKIRLVMVGAQEVDLAQATGLAMIRGGKSSQRANRLLHEVVTFMPKEAA